MVKTENIIQNIRKNYNIDDDTQQLCIRFLGSNNNLWTLVFNIKCMCFFYEWQKVSNSVLPLLPVCRFLVFMSYQMYYDYPPLTYLEYPILIAQGDILTLNHE